MATRSRNGNACADIARSTSNKCCCALVWFTLAGNRPEPLFVIRNEKGRCVSSRKAFTEA
jgi:hypothetical protein